MNTKEYVKFKNDTNFVPVRYFVIEVNVGSSDSNTHLWLKVAGYGMDTQEHYEEYVNAVRHSAFDGGRPDGLEGTMGNYEVANLSQVEAYRSRYGNNDGPFPVG